MKKIIVLTGLSALLACATRKQVVSYDFPPAMNASVRAQYLEQCQKGALLYEQHCAACHSVQRKGKTIIPDFTQEKLNGYAIRVANRTHEENMPDSLVSVEDLGLITTFFLYKKKSTIHR